MRKVFARLDDLLIERLFQPLIDVLNDRIGVGWAACACVCTDVASLAWIVSRARALSGAVDHWRAGAAVGEFGLLLLGLTALVSLRMLFRRTARHRRCNPLRPAMRSHRAFVLILLAARLMQMHVPGVSDAADAMMLLFSASALYLGACAERPPIRRRDTRLAAAGVG